MKKKHIIWLLLIVGIGIAAFYGYRVQQEAAQAPSPAHQQATVTDETEAADTSADDEAAGVDAVSEDIAAEEAAAKKTDSSPTDEAVGPRVDVVPAQAQEQIGRAHV